MAYDLNNLFCKDGPEGLRRAIRQAELDSTSGERSRITTLSEICYYQQMLIERQHRMFESLLEQLAEKFDTSFLVDYSIAKPTFFEEEPEQSEPSV